MNMIRRSFLITAGWVACLQAFSGPTPQGYWPEWRGADRSNRSSETGLLQSWPEEGPPLLWKATGLGEGIASVAVAQGRIYTIGYAETREFIYALRADTGESIWITSIGPAVSENALMRWLSQRTPTLDEDRIYTVTASGELFCLRASDGQKVWHKSYSKDFGSRRPWWGFGDRPLVDGEKLICAPGGTNASIVALDKRTGEVLWKTVVSADHLGSYGATVLSEAGGIRQYLVFLERGLWGIAADDGRVLWEYTKTVGRAGNSYTPLTWENFVFSANGYGAGMALLRIVRDGDTWRAEEQYHRPFDFNPFQDSTVLIGDHLYTFERMGKPVCLDVRTGESVWGPVDTSAQDRVAVTFADGHLYVRRSSGRMVLQKATSEGYHETSAFRIPEPEEASGATAPVVAGGRLYLRDNRRLLCYDITANALRQPSPPPRTVDVSLGPPWTEASGPLLPTAGTERIPDAIFVPTPEDIVEQMLHMAEVTQTDHFVDLGSGDGRIVMAAARSHGSKSVGYEIDPQLVEVSRETIRQNGLEALATIEQADLFTADLGAADVIAVYLPPELLTRLVPQFGKLKPGARIVSHQFRIPGFPPDRVTTVISNEDGEPHRLYLWTAPIQREEPLPGPRPRIRGQPLPPPNPGGE